MYELLTRVTVAQLLNFEETEETTLKNNQF